MRLASWQICHLVVFHHHAYDSSLTPCDCSMYQHETLNTWQQHNIYSITCTGLLRSLTHLTVHEVQGCCQAGCSTASAADPAFRPVCGQYVETSISCSNGQRPHMLTAEAVTQLSDKEETQPSICLPGLPWPAVTQHCQSPTPFMTSNTQPASNAPGILSSLGQRTRLEHRQGCRQVGSHKAQAHAACIRTHHGNQVCGHPAGCGISGPPPSCSPDLSLQSHTGMARVQQQQQQVTWVRPDLDVTECLAAVLDLLRQAFTAG